MEPSCSIPAPARPAQRRLANGLAIALFALAAGLLAGLEQWAWRDAIAPHADLVSRVPADAVVLGQRVDEFGTGPHATSYPRVLYHYEIKGEAFESSVIRHPRFVRTNAGESSTGEVRFAGPEREKRTEQYLKQYPAGQRVTAWVNLVEPRDAMLVRQELDPSPFLFGLMPALFVPFVWMFLAAVLKVMLGSPQGRYVAFGWGLLTLAGAGPIAWHYRQLADVTEATLLMRALNVWLGLAAVILLGSLLAGPFRGGLFVGLVLCFTLLAGIGAGSAAIIGKYESLFGWEIDPNLVFVRFLEYALISGTGFGLLLGLGARTGVVTIRSDN